MLVTVGRDAIMKSEIERRQRCALRGDHAGPGWDSHGLRPDANENARAYVIGRAIGDDDDAITLL